MRRFRPLEVIDLGERLRYEVRSETRPQVDHYLVDLGANNQWGWCNCKHHATRFEPWLKKGRVFPAQDRCKHIQAAREYLASVFISAVMLRYPDQNQD
jgi:hypothetical protein